MDDALHVTYEGRLVYADKLVQRLRDAGVEVRWQRPEPDEGDLVGETLVEVDIRVGDDVAAVQQVLSRFREYYPKGRVSLVTPAR